MQEIIQFFQEIPKDILTLFSVFIFSVVQISKQWFIRKKWNFQALPLTLNWLVSAFVALLIVEQGLPFKSTLGLVILYTATLALTATGIHSTRSIGKQAEPQEDTEIAEIKKIVDKL